jgi:hypothetical protein
MLRVPTNTGVGAMSFANAVFDPPTLNLMAHALDSAWREVQASVTDLGDADRAQMARAIVRAVASGERDYDSLKLLAVGTLGERLDRGTEPQKRRWHNAWRQ